MARILLVDDDRELLAMASALLVHEQFEVSVCENAIDALELIRRESFDVVITDANMTPHSGFDLIRSIKLLPSYDLVPIAMLTGRREKRDVERALSVGARDYIVKPLDPMSFIKKVTELAMISEDHRRTAKFAELTLDEVANCELPLVIIGLTESGVLIDSDHRFHIGSQLTLDSEVFNRIGIPRPVVRVTSCTEGAISGSFEVRTSFASLDEKNSMKIRHYVQAQASQTSNSKRTQKAS
jgi:CheY-like chemotaxis protein